MTDDELVEHLDEVKEQVKALSQRQADAFGLSCIERMLPAYRRASVGQRWDGGEVLRRMVDQAWNSLALERPLEPGTAEACREAIPNDEDLDSFETAVAFHIGNAVADFLTQFEEGRDSYGYFMAARGIDVIDLLDDDSDIDTDVIDGLYELEMSRQNADLERVRGATGVEDLLNARRGGEAPSVLGAEWI